MRTVVFIHGAWLTPACWDGFRARYEARGWRVIAPSWPLEDRPIEELRTRPDPKLARIGIREIVDHYAAIVAGCPQPPLLVGHSFGGLFVQQLLDRGLGSAGIAIDPAPPRGVFATAKGIRGNLRVILAPFGWRRVLRLPFEVFAASFAQDLPAAEQRAVYDRHIVPAPGRPFFQVGFGIANGVRFGNPSRAPLLIIAGSDDRTVDPVTIRANYRKYRRSPAVTDYLEFPGRSHWLIAGPGWEAVADATLDWAEGRRSD
jgi:pimeloyl-ACP methyl ester carboxylesterase